METASPKRCDLSSLNRSNDTLFPQFANSIKSVYTEHFLYPNYSINSSFADRACSSNFLRSFLPFTMNFSKSKSSSLQIPTIPLMQHLRIVISSGFFSFRVLRKSNYSFKFFPSPSPCFSTMQCVRDRIASTLSLSILSSTIVALNQRSTVLINYGSVTRNQNS